MRSVQKILFGVFLGGVLLGGIGTGIAFVEYSSIAYAGERRIGEENLVTEDFDFSFQQENGGIMVVSRRYDDVYPYTIEEDTSVPEDVIRYQVTYNPETVTPALNFTECIQDEEKPEDILQQTESPETLWYQGELRLNAWYHGDDFAIWMANKDEILKDLKQGRIASYRMDYITAVKIKVNPQTMPYVKIVN